MYYSEYCGALARGEPFLIPLMVLGLAGSVATLSARRRLPPWTSAWLSVWLAMWAGVALLAWAGMLGSLTAWMLAVGAGAMALAGLLWTTMRMGARLRRTARDVSDWRALADQGCCAEGIIDNAGKLIWVNTAAERFTGFSRSELLACEDYLAAIVHPGDLSKARNAVSRGLTGLAGTNICFRMRRKDGMEWWGSCSWQTARNGEGNAVGIRMSMRDVSGLVGLQAELRRQRDFVRLLLDTVPAGVLVVDADGNILRTNNFLEETLRFQPGQMTDRDFVEDCLPPDQRPGVQAWLRNVLAGGEPTPRTCALTDADHHRHLLQWHPALLRDPEGTALGVLMVGMDMTTLRLQENQLRDAQNMQAIGRLAGGIAHEFNNLLTTVLGNAQLLQMFPDHKERADMLGQIVESANTASTLTAQLLAYARQGKWTDKRMDLTELVESLADRIRAELSGSVQLVTRCPEGPIWIRGDRRQISDSLVRMGRWARRHMPDGGKLSLHLSAVRLEPDDVDAESGELLPGHYARLDITDDGPPLSQADLRGALDPFATDEQPIEAIRHNLQLASVYGCMRSHRGTARITNSPEGHAYISLLLPEDRPAAPAEEPALSIVARSPGKVLVIDDEPSVRKLATRALTKAGLNVTTCSSGPQALKRLASANERFDLVLLDIVMPEMDGWEVLERIRDEHPRLPVIMTSGFQCAVPPLYEGSTPPAFLAKPFRVEHLVQAVDEHLPDRHQQEAPGGSAGG